MKSGVQDLPIAPDRVRGIGRHPAGMENSLCQSIRCQKLCEQGVKKTGFSRVGKFQAEEQEGEKRTKE